ncbi:hypothetical protein JCM11251_007553 [Rhodosporidiobolus azoricus]
MSRSKHQLYQADDADYDEAGNRLPLGQQDEEEEEWAEQDECGEGDLNGDEEVYDDDEYGPGVTVIRAEKPAAPQTDLAVEHYLDPLALVNCWESALLDLKDMHPDRFLPPAEAPRSLTQKQQRAPIWYGPPPSAASTSRLPPSPQVSAAVPTSYSAFLAVAQASAQPLHEEYVEEAEEEEEQPVPKKRKRLTGSQKKARKAAKLVATASASEGKGKNRAEEEDEEQSEEPALQQASHLPQSAGPSQPPSASLPFSTAPSAAHVSPPPSSRPPHPSSFSFLVPPMGRLPPPGSLTGPPPITPLTGEEPPLEAETASGLLESMLWSYYTAGYQTALYHAAIGVAKFKHEVEGGKGGTA